MKERAERLKGETAKYEMCDSLYITINKEVGGEIYEIFCSAAKLGICKAFAEAFARLSSLCFQGGKTEWVIKASELIKCPAQARRMGMEVIKKEKELTSMPWSCPDAVSREIKRHLEEKK